MVNNEDKKLELRYGILKNKEKLLGTIRRLEKQEIWIQPFPSWSILCKELIEYAVCLALEDFKQNKNIARKLNVEILLRFSGVDQIRDAIRKFDINEGEEITLVILNNKENIQDVKEVFRNDSVEDIRKHSKITPILSKIKALYGFTGRYLKSVRKGRQITERESIIRAVREQIGALLIK